MATSTSFASLRRISGERVRAVEARSLAKVRAAALAGVDSGPPALTSKVDTPSGRREDR
jgi:hypothetical protein